MERERERERAGSTKFRLYKEREHKLTIINVFELPP